MKTENQRLLGYLSTGKSITVLEAMTKLGIYNCRSRISNLANDGHNILRSWRTVIKKDGQTARVRVYSLGGGE